MYETLQVNVAVGAKPFFAETRDKQTKATYENANKGGNKHRLPVDKARGSR